MINTTTKEPVKTANIELRDSDNNVVKVIKKNVPLLHAMDYVNKHEVIWKGCTPYTTVLAF